MNVEEIKVAILRIEGTNCEDESFQAFRALGTSPEYVHLKQLTVSGIKDARKLSDYQIVMFPGGFSAGDYVRAGAILAARIRSKLEGDLKDYIENGYPIIGICNGFQVMVELGILPGLDRPVARRPEAALFTNDSSRFECRPTLLKHVNRGNSRFTTKIPKGEIRLIPSAHAEGKLTFPPERKDEIMRRLEENDQIVFRYVDPEGNEDAGYPWNPNGTEGNIAGITNPTGTVLGMMPHPERVFTPYTHPDWTRKDITEGAGRAIFESIVDYVRRTF